MSGQFSHTIRRMFMWQDTAMMLIQFGFGAAMVPTLLHKDHKPSFLSCISTATLGVATVMVFLSLKLWLGAFAATLVSTAWWIITYQRYRINKRTGIPLVTIPPWLAWVPPL